MRTIAAAERHKTSTDVALIERARRGDAGAFEILVTTRLDRCYRLAWSILSNDADAADAMQDALVSAWQQIPRLRDPAAFDGWLNRVVANAARTARRKRGRRREVPVAAATDAGEATLPNFDVEAGRHPKLDGGIDRILEGDAIVRAFERLKPDDRMLLALHHVEERPVAEIARTLGVPVGTAKWRLHAARRALERAMEGDA